MNVNPSDKSKPHTIGKPIRYRGKGKYAGQIVKPQDGAVLTFAHLEDVDYMILRRNGTLVPQDEKKPASSSKSSEKKS